MSSTDPDTVARQIRTLEAKRIAAMCGQDLTTLAAMLADDLTYTHSRGETDTKSSFLELIRNPGDHGRYLGVEFSDEQVVPLGDAVVVRGRAQITLERPAGQPPLSYPVLFLDVWEQREGTWRLVAWQATRTKPAS
jgi:ketosteroid isomerase-like protein